MPVSPFNPITGWFDPTFLDDGSETNLAPTDQRSRPHIFVNKLRRRAGANKTLATRDAPSRVLTVNDWAEMYAAAEFADRSEMRLDVHVTLDFARMGIFQPAHVQRELSRFIRCYAAWANDRYIPVAWMYRIEMSSQTNYHAHILVFVPGRIPQLGDPRDAPQRREFRAWAKGYTKRNLGQHIPKAIRVRYGYTESRFTHWLLVSYLMKGFDRNAVVCSSRNSPHGFPIYLGDLIAHYYCDPGPIALHHHYGISENLGPKQRRFGAPKGFEPILPRQPNWKNFCFDTNAMTDSDEMAIIRTVPKPTPFVSTFEDGIRDIRRLYPAFFHQSVTRLKATDDPLMTNCPETFDWSTAAAQIAALGE